MIGRSGQFKCFKEHVQQPELNWESRKIKHQAESLSFKESHHITFPRQMQSLAVV